MELDLKEMNQSYTKEKLAKSKVEKLKEQIAKIEPDIKSLTRRIEDVELEIKRAEEDKETSKAKTSKDLLKALKEDLSKKKAQLSKLKAPIERSEKAIDSRIEELSKNPELKAHLVEVTSKKFSREIAKKQKEKDALLGENEVFQKIKETAQKKPAVMAFLYMMEEAFKDIDILNQQLNDPTIDPTVKPQISADITTNNGILANARAGLARELHGTVSREVIDKITSFGSLDILTRANNRYINGLNKQMANYQVALQNLGIEAPTRAETPAPTPTPTPAPARGSNLPDTPTKPKWYQLVKKFKNWNAKRKAEIEAAKNPESPVTETEKASFKDSMKYEVVRDYQEKLATDLLKQAKAQNKEAAKKDQDAQTR